MAARRVSARLQSQSQSQSPAQASSPTEGHAQTQTRARSHSNSRILQQAHPPPPPPRSQLRARGPAQRQETQSVAPAQNTDAAPPAPFDLAQAPKPFKNVGTRKPTRFRLMKQLLSLEQQRCSAAGEHVAWLAVAAGPSVRPSPTYCDVTGVPAHYRDPRTMLNYFGPEVYAWLRAMPEHQLRAYRAIRHRHSDLAAGAGGPGGISGAGHLGKAI